MFIDATCKKKHPSRDNLIATDFFGKYITRDRFLSFLKYWHFADNNEPDEKDRLWKIRSVLSLVRKRFADYFSLFQKLVIDEPLMLFKGRLILKFYIPTNVIVLESKFKSFVIAKLKLC